MTPAAQAHFVATLDAIFRKQPVPPPLPVDPLALFATMVINTAVAEADDDILAAFLDCDDGSDARFDAAVAAKYPDADRSPK